MDQSDQETWDDTKKILEKVISENIDNLTYDEAFHQIKRAHTGKPNRNRQEPDNIFVLIRDWDVSQLIISKFRLKNIQDKNFNVSVEQKYRPRTTWRRNYAMKERKELKEKGIIIRASVAFPAKLMVMKAGGDQYVLHKDYSKIPVDFSPKRES